jgi:protein transport protein SEC23
MMAALISIMSLLVFHKAKLYIALYCMQEVKYPPVLCKGKDCGATLNPFATVDYASKMWVCPFCASRNYFPAHYAEIIADHAPVEVIDTSTTLEYILQEADETGLAPTYVFIVDTAVSEDELEACKNNLGQVLQMMPEHCFIGEVLCLH